MSSDGSTFARSSVRSYSLDGDVILFQERRGELFALNSTASWIWLRLSDGLSPDEVVAELSGETGVARAQIALDIGNLIDQWKQAGLLDATDEAVDAVAPVAEVPAGTAEVAPARPSDRSAGPGRAFRLMDSGIRVKADPDVFAVVNNLIGHAAVADADWNAAWPTFEVRKEADRWVVIFDGQRLGDCRERTEIAPLIYGATSMLAYQASRCFAVVHAAAVARGSKAVVLPGVPGNGKSTLAAALVAKGYEFCADDLAILAPPEAAADAPLCLKPVGLPMGLKSGSWPVLEHLWPELAELPAHRRADGKVVKYLLPEGRAAAEARFSVTAVVFPKYSTGARARLDPLPRSEALARMAEAGYDLPSRLSHDVVQTMVQWFEGLSCYDLHFDDVDEAAEVFSRVFR